MPKYRNYLRVYRKKSHLTQADIAYLMDAEEPSSLSRRESGQRQPTIKMLLTYHVLFNIPITQFFPIELAHLKQRIIHRIRDLITTLETTHSVNDRKRILTLQAILTRLSSSH